VNRPPGAGPGSDGEDGISILEVVIVMAILLVVGGAIFGAIGTVQNLAVGESRRTENLNQARVAMGAANRSLAQNVGILDIVPACSGCIGSSDVTFLSQIGADADPARKFVPNKVRLYVDTAQQVVEEVTMPDDPTADPITYNGAPRRRVLAGSVVDQHGLFIFYDDQKPPRTTTDEDEAASVWINLAIRTASNGSVPATVIQNWVWLLQGTAEIDRTAPTPPTSIAPTTTAPPTTVAPPTTAGPTTTVKPTTTTKATATTAAPPTTVKATTTTAPRPTTTMKAVPK
jgi:type II secretory pathway pseudopilin PulG